MAIWRTPGAARAWRRARRPAWWAAATALRVVLPVLLVSILPVARPASAAAQEATLVGFAEAYTTAWNAHDVEAVLGFFASDAVVRQRGADLPDAVWNAHDESTVRAYLDTAAGWAREVSWARGGAAIRALLVDTFRSRPHVEAFDYQAAGDTVTWRYRLRQDPYQLIPGVGPVEGSAEAVVRAGRITRLSLVHDPQSVAHRDAAVAARARSQPARPGPAADGVVRSVPGTPVGRRNAAGAPEPFSVALPLLILALASAAAAIAVLRERERRTAASCGR